MPRTEDNGHFLTIGGLQRLKEITHTTHPHQECLLVGTAHQHILHNCRVANVPGRSLRELLTSQTTTGNSGQRVTGMPADGDDTTTLIVLDNLLTHTGEGHAVEVLGIAHLDAAELKAHHSGPVATDVLHIAGILVVVPGQTIERIVLMTEHISLITKRVEALHQLLCYRLLRFSLFLCCTGGDCYCRDCHCNNLIHNYF